MKHADIAGVIEDHDSGEMRKFGRAREVSWLKILMWGGIFFSVFCSFIGYYTVFRWIWHNWFWFLRDLGTAWGAM